MAGVEFPQMFTQPGNNSKSTQHEHTRKDYLNTRPSASESLAGGNCHDIKIPCLQLYCHKLPMT